MADRFGTAVLSCFLVTGQFSQTHGENSQSQEPVYRQYAAASTQELPTTSCTIIGRTESDTHCFLRCTTMMSNIRFLSSRDSGTGRCACCYLPLSGSVLNGSKWESFLEEDTAALTKAEVWVQGEEVNGVWQFHDDIPFVDHFCPLSESNHIGENHIRLVPRSNFSCSDMLADRSYNFVCEISFRSPSQ